MTTQKAPNGEPSTIIKNGKVIRIGNPVKNDWTRPRPWAPGQVPESIRDGILPMLSYARPTGSGAEKAFRQRFIHPLGVGIDAAGNLIKRIGTAPILWSCHTDTVHRKSGKQYVALYDDIVELSKESQHNCLGADDTAGVWLMCEMIRAEVPGLYIFHYGEETGGTGSQFIAKSTTKLLSGIKAAVALDRKGTHSIITHQFERCCSDDFANSLGKALNLGMSPDDSGVFTDTANYVDDIGECSNISVGYYDQHSSYETLDLSFLAALRDRLIGIDLSVLTFKRQPGEPDPDYTALDSYWERRGSSLTVKRYDETGSNSGTSRSLETLVEDYPEVAADILERMGYDPKGFMGEIQALYGMSDQERDDWERW